MTGLLMLLCVVCAVSWMLVGSAVSAQEADNDEGSNKQYLATVSSEDNSTQPELTTSTVYRTDTSFTNSEVCHCCLQTCCLPNSSHPRAPLPVPPQTTIFEAEDDWKEIGENEALPRVSDSPEQRMH